jgi:hypothetical protein
MILAHEAGKETLSEGVREGFTIHKFRDAFHVMPEVQIAGSKQPGEIAPGLVANFDAPKVHLHLQRIRANAHARCTLDDLPDLPGNQFFFHGVTCYVFWEMNLPEKMERVGVGRLRLAGMTSTIASSWAWSLAAASFMVSAYILITNERKKYFEKDQKRNPAPKGTGLFGGQGCTVPAAPSGTGSAKTH